MSVVFVPPSKIDEQTARLAAFLRERISKGIEIPITRSELQAAKILGAEKFEDVL
jgi:hypothetical protein